MREQLDATDLDGRSVCLVVPDATRSCPLPLLVGAVHSALAGRVTRLTALVALGTHAPLSPDATARHLGYAERGLAATYPGLTVLDHAWWEPETFVDLGTIPAERVRELSGGRLDRSVEVRLNRAVVEHDVALVVGPVFPHEVVGFSGGNKYFFPGVGGQEVIDLSHWLGALITSRDIIGRPGITPVRALIDEAAALVPAQRLALSVVVRPGGQWRRPQLRGVRRSGDILGGGGEGRGPDPRALPRPSGRAGGLPDPRAVRRHVDGGQGLLQAGARRGGRRRGHPLRAAHHRDLAHAPGDQPDRLSLPRLLPGPVGPVRRLPLGRARPLDPPAGSRHLRPRAR